MTQTIAISFLGANDSAYSRAKYVFNSEHFNVQAWDGITSFMAEAIARTFQPKVIYILVTEKAREQSLPLLQARLEQWSGRLQAVSIPDGQSEADMWAIFNQINHIISTSIRDDCDSEIVFDITNGFRSLPLLGFIAASFIKVAKNIQIKHMLYGAFDAGNRLEENGQVYTPTPVFDLSPFLQLLDWTNAASTLIETGRADRLAYLVQEKAATYPHAQAISHALYHFTQELLTTRPNGTMNAAYTLQQALDGRQNLAAHLQPFDLLLERISTEYGAFALDNPQTQPYQNLQIQLAMIKWYVAKKLPIQAITLAREWIVSFAIELQGGLDMYEHGDRQVVSTFINTKYRRATVQFGPQKGLDIKLNKRLKPFLPLIKGIWKDVNSYHTRNHEVRDIRNDLAHCGMRHNARPAEDIIASLGQIYEQLELVWKLHCSKQGYINDAA